MSTTFQIILFYVISIVLIVAILLFIQNKRIKKLKQEMEFLERQKNLLIGAPILNELLKVEKLVKNSKYEYKYDNWKNKFEEIKNNLIPEISEMLIDADVILEKKDFELLAKKIIVIEFKIYRVKMYSNDMLEEIREITLSEERNRETVVKLKANYRFLLQHFEKNKEDYEEVAKPIELQFENIEKLFQNFEDAMEKNEYEEVSHVVKALSESIEHMQVVVDEVPSIMLMVKDLIPKKMEDVTSTYIKMTREGYRLEYLRVEYNVMETEKKLSNILDKVKVLNLEDLVFELKTILGYFESIFNDYERERLARKLYEEEVNIFGNKFQKLTKLMTDMILQMTEMQDIYDVKESDVEKLKGLNDKLQKLGDDFEELLKNENDSFFKLNGNIEDLRQRLSSIEDDFSNCIELFGSLKDDEKRAKEQLEDIKGLLKKAKNKIREYKFPKIPERYYIELSDANEAIKEIKKSLNARPLSVATVNIRVDTARDLVFKVFNTTTDLIKTASLVEKLIVYGNRYRSSKSDVAEGLLKSEVLFNKGEYQKALEVVVSSIDIVEPDIHKKIVLMLQNEK